MALQRSSSLDSLKVIPADDYERSAFALSPDVYGSADDTAVSAPVPDAADDPRAVAESKQKAANESESDGWSQGGAWLIIYSTHRARVCTSPSVRYPPSC